MTLEEENMALRRDLESIRSSLEEFILKPEDETWLLALRAKRRLDHLKATLKTLQESSESPMIRL